MVQRAYFEQWRKQGRGKFDQAPNLEQVTRPKLDQLTNELLQELARTWPALVDVRESARFEKKHYAKQLIGLACKKRSI